MITSIQNKKIKLVRDLLHTRKHRDASSLMVLEGVRLAEEALRAEAEVVQCLYSENLSPRGAEILAGIRPRSGSVDELPPDLLNRVSDTQNSQGILLVCPFPAIPFPKDPTYIVVLDQISDPGNMGTILRAAAALHVDGILLTPGTTDPYSPKALRAAMGAQFHLPLAWKDSREIAAFCSSNANPIILTASRMDCPHACWDADLTRPICLVIGGEADGVSPGLQAASNECLRIPMGENTESFNAAVAASILMYEISRQRNKK